MDKNIYFFWEGDHLPFLEYLSMFSFRKQNPEWKILVIHKRYPGMCRWPTGEHKRPRSKQRNYFDQLPALNVEILDFDTEFREILSIDPKIAFVHAKDLASWSILAHRGGIVSDTDILYINPVSGLYNEFVADSSKIGAISFDNYPKKDYIPVSFMMGDKSECFAQILCSAISKYNPGVYECSGTPAIPYKDIFEIKALFPGEVFRIHESVVFPFTHVNFVESIDHVYKYNSRDLMPKSSIGIHWYGGNINNDYNETNFHTFNNTLCQVIKEIVCQNHNSQSVVLA